LLPLQAFLYLLATLRHLTHQTEATEQQPAQANHTMNSTTEQLTPHGLSEKSVVRVPEAGQIDIDPAIICIAITTRVHFRG
jgi:hypothetical protein